MEPDLVVFYDIWFGLSTPELSRGREMITKTWRKHNV